MSMDITPSNAIDFGSACLDELFLALPLSQGRPAAGQYLRYSRCTRRHRECDILRQMLPLLDEIFSLLLEDIFSFPNNPRKTRGVSYL